MGKQLFIMIGAPGSGKTTWVKKQLRPDMDAYVSRDEIRFSKLQDGEDYFAHEKEVFNEFVESIAKYLIEDINIYRVFADASHLNAKSRKKLLNALIAKGVDPKAITVNYIWMYTTLTTCLERNRQREGLAMVPESTVIEMYKSQKEPEVDEIVSKVYIINEHRKCIDIKYMSAQDTNNFEY